MNISQETLALKKRKELEANEALREDIEVRGGYKEYSMNEEACKAYNNKVLSSRRYVPLSDEYPPARERTKKQQHRLSMAMEKSTEAFFWACIIDELAPNEQRTIDKLYSDCLFSQKSDKRNRSWTRGNGSSAANKALLDYSLDLDCYYPTGKRRARFITYNVTTGSYLLQRKANGKTVKYISSVDYEKVVNKAQELFPEDFYIY
ncbi:TPA: hypothetical protein N2N45_002402 [Klebsiella aerogenes]|nr:hypothetical protein [Klebsiella aerogenes]